MQKIDNDILASKPEGDIAALRAQVKQTEASMWCMNGGSSKSAKTAREPIWCPNYKPFTHNLDQCRGNGYFCGCFGLKSNRFKDHPENKDIEGAVKSAKAGESLESEEVKRAKKNERR